MNLLDKVKNKAKGLETGTEQMEKRQASMPNADKSAKFLLMNDGVNIVATACACCWDSQLPASYDERKTYIGKRAKTGHTSIMEHSNLVLYLKIDFENTIDLVNFLSTNFYLHTCTKIAGNGGYHLIVGGSWRAYSDLYLHIDRDEMEQNAVYRRITQAIFSYVPEEAMEDFVQKGIFTSENFDASRSVPFNNIASSCSSYADHRLNEHINIKNCDDIEALTSAIAYCCDEPWLFTYADLLPFCTVTIEFNGMSRIITQQLTRHRNGITQESQRYVDYSGAPFNSPALFKPQKYDAKRLYTFTFGGKEFKMNLQALGDAINSIYPQLKDKLKYGTQALVSEDARGYLANNTQCGKIFITFTYYSLIKFLQLREDMHAQPEIHQYALTIGEWFRDNLGFIRDADMGADSALYSALIPKMLVEENNWFAQPIADLPVTTTKSTTVVTDDANEVAEAMSEEEYARLVGQSIDHADKHPDEVDKSDPVEVLPEEKGKPSWDAEGMR